MTLQSGGEVVGGFACREQAHHGSNLGGAPGQILLDTSRHLRLTPPRLPPAIFGNMTLGICRRHHCTVFKN